MSALYQELVVERKMGGHQMMAIMNERQLGEINAAQFNTYLDFYGFSVAAKADIATVHAGNSRSHIDNVLMLGDSADGSPGYGDEASWDTRLGL